MDLKRLKKNAFMLIVITVLIVYNVGSFYAVAYKGQDIFAPSTNNQPLPTPDPSTNIDNVINPPLGNETTLPNATTLFTLMVFNLPIEIAIVFLVEMLVGSMFRTEKKRMNFLRLLLLLGSAALLSIGSSTIQYFAVWPAMHDFPIHAGHTFNETILLPNGTLIYEVRPQYGEDIETFFTLGVDVILMIVAGIVIVGLHFPVFKWLQKLNNKTNVAGLFIPALYYFIIWFTLARQVSGAEFEDKTASHFNLSLLLALGFVLGVFLILIWNLTLAGGKVKKMQTVEAEKYDE
ncbi:MAG: hypothetical protein ACTSQB_01280 [Candidatus Heimdallarchaeota archaeon]